MVALRQFGIILLLESFFLVSPVLSNQVKPTSDKTVIPDIVERMDISGNYHFADKEIKKQMVSEERRWYHFFRKKRRITERFLQFEKAAIDSFYHSQGFLKATSSVEAQPGSREDKAVLEVTIHEGSQTLIEELKLIGDIGDFSNEVWKSFKTIMPGSPLDKTALRQVAQGMKDVYADHGYPHAEVNVGVEISEDGRSATVTFSVDPGELVHFGRLGIVGLAKTREEVARREVTFKEGEIYRRKKIIDSQQYLYSTGLFSYVSLSAIKTSPDPLRADMLLTVGERSSNYVNFKLGAGQDYERDLTFETSVAWGNRNIWRRGHRLDLSVASGFQVIPDWNNYRNRLSVSYLWPWWILPRVPLSLDFTYEPGKLAINRDYVYDDFSASFGLSRELRRVYLLGLTYQYEHIHVHDIPADQQATFRAEKEIKVRRKLILNLSKDSRSNIFTPSGGSLTSFSAQYVGGLLGGDIDLLKYDFSWARYNRCFLGGVLATRLKGSLVTQFGQTKAEEVPSEDRLFLGGAYTVRGYQEATLGPVYSAADSVDPGLLGDPKGGKVLLVGNVEFRKNLFWRLGGQLFFDLGNLWYEPEHINSEDLRLTGGAGIVFFTPVGPLRLDYARRIITAGDSYGGRFHLSILYAF
jgi:outer membrane protein insertion porin family